MVDELRNSEGNEKKIKNKKLKKTEKTGPVVDEGEFSSKLPVHALRSDQKD